MDSNRNYLQLPQKQTKNKTTETTQERKHNPQKAVVDKSWDDEKAEKQNKTKKIVGYRKHK